MAKETPAIDMAPQPRAEGGRGEALTAEQSTAQKRTEELIRDVKTALGNHFDDVAKNQYALDLSGHLKDRGLLGHIQIEGLDAKGWLVLKNEKSGEYGVARYSTTGSGGVTIDFRDTLVLPDANGNPEKVFHSGEPMQIVSSDKVGPLVVKNERGNYGIVKNGSDGQPTIEFKNVIVLRDSSGRPDRVLHSGENETKFNYKKGELVSVINPDGTYYEHDYKRDEWRKVIPWKYGPEREEHLGLKTPVDVDESGKLIFEMNPGEKKRWLEAETSAKQIYEAATLVGWNDYPAIRKALAGASSEKVAQIDSIFRKQYNMGLEDYLSLRLKDVITGHSEEILEFIRSSLESYKEQEWERRGWWR